MWNTVQHTQYILDLYNFDSDEYAVNQQAHNVLNPKTREEYFVFEHQGQRIKLTLVDKN